MARAPRSSNILDFERDYPDAQVFLMEQNYRSTANILAVANALIEHNTQRKPKNLWTDAAAGELVVTFRANDEHEEALFVATEVERLRDEEGLRARDVAVFYRTNAMSRVVEDVFMRVGVPYRVFGGVRFYQRREIKDVLGYLRLLLNPQDVVSFRRVVNMPKRGIGDATVAAVEAFAARRRDRRRSRPAGASTRSRVLNDAGQGRGRRVQPGSWSAHPRAPRGRCRAGADGRVRGPGVRLPDRARDGAHDRGAGADREPPGALGGGDRDRRA